MPTNVLSGNYTALSWPPDGNNAGFVAITGTVDGTSVEVIGADAIAVGAGLTTAGSGTVTLNAGDVLEIIAHERRV